MISPLFLRIFLLDRGFWVASFFISAFENILSVSSYLYGFWWEILCHSNGFYPPCKMSFFCGCFQEFFLVCFNQKLNYVVFAYRFISISYLRFTQLFENIDISWQIWGIFSHSSFQFFQLWPLSLLIQACDEMNVRSL